MFDRKIAVACLLIFAVCVLALAYFARSNSQPTNTDKINPTINSVVYEKQVRLGNTVRIWFNVTDISGIRDAKFKVTGPDNRTIAYGLGSNKIRKTNPLIFKPNGNVEYIDIK